MKHNFQIFTRAVFCAVCTMIFAAATFAQTTITGDWKASVRTENSAKANKAETEDRTNKLQLSFYRTNEKGGKNQNGSSFAYADLQGLSREQALSGGTVKFSIVREAGTIECEGTFQDGKGAGTYRFTSNPQFVSAMKTRGFDFEKSTSKSGRDTTDERLFSAALIGVTTALADDLVSANFGNLDVDDLFKAAIFKVDSKFMREMKASGFPNLGMEELVKARIFNIDSEFLRELNTNGFSNEPFENIVKMRIFKITPEFINGVRSEGFNNITIEQLVKMKIFNINSEFIRQARSEGVPMDIEKLVQKRIGVWGK
jgi:hypothetical protein